MCVCVHYMCATKTALSCQEIDWGSLRVSCGPLAVDLLGPVGWGGPLFRPGSVASHKCSFGLGSGEF